MQKTVYVTAAFLLSFLHIFNSAPVSMFESYKKLFSDSMCVMPKTVKLPDINDEKNSIFHLPLTSCRKITRSDDKRPIYDICYKVFDGLYSIADCGPSSGHTSNIDFTVNVPLPNENVCELLKNISPSQLLFPDSLKDNQSCVQICTIYSDLCRSLLWIYAVKEELGKHKTNSDINKEPLIPFTSMEKELSVRKTKKPNLPHVDTNSSLIISESSIVEAIVTVTRPDISLKTISAEKPNDTLKTDEIVIENKSPVVISTEKSFATPNVESMVNVVEPIEETDKENEKSVIDNKKLKSSKTIVKEQARDMSIIEPKKSDLLQTTKTTQNVNSFENGDFEKDYDEQGYAVSPFQENSDKDKTIAGIIKEKIYQSHENSKPQLPLESDSSDIGYSKDIHGDVSTEPDESHFFLYFLFVVAIFIGCYVLFHNKQKIIALIVEGRHERRRRPNGVSYKKLETKT